MTEGCRFARKHHAREQSLLSESNVFGLGFVFK